MLRRGKTTTQTTTPIHTIFQNKNENEGWRRKYSKVAEKDSKRSKNQNLSKGAPCHETWFPRVKNCDLFLGFKYQGFTLSSFCLWYERSNNCIINNKQYGKECQAKYLHNMICINSSRRNNNNYSRFCIQIRLGVANYNIEVLNIKFIVWFYKSKQVLCVVFQVTSFWLYYSILIYSVPLFVV